MNMVEQTNNFCINYLNCVKKAASILWITQSQAICIQSIPFYGISQTDLAKKLALDLSTLSRNLDKLIKINLVEKSPSQFDKRSFKITLTSRGKTLYRNLNSQINDCFHEIYNKLEVSEVDFMIDILNKINWEFDLLENEKS